MIWKGFKDVRATIEIDLFKSEEELWDALDKDARWGVKKAQKSGLEVKQIEREEDWKKFYEIYKVTCKYGKIVPLSFEEIKESLLFGCFFEEKLIAGAAIKKEVDKIVLFLNASEHEYLRYQPNNLLYWSLIVWGKKNKVKTFDLGGYQLNTKKGDKLHEVNKFKMRWGGEVKEYPIYSKNPVYILGRKVIRNSSSIKKVRDNLKVKMNKDKFKESS